MPLFPPSNSLDGCLAPLAFALEAAEQTTKEFAESRGQFAPSIGCKDALWAVIEQNRTKPTLQPLPYVARYSSSAIACENLIRRFLAKQRMAHMEQADPDAMPALIHTIAAYSTKNATLYYNEFVRRLRENLKTIGSYNAEIFQATA